MVKSFEGINHRAALQEVAAAEQASQAAKAQQQSTAVADDLPPAPPGCPAFTTMKEVGDMPADQYKKHYFGPNSQMFRDRVAAIIAHSGARSSYYR
jgi:hypothetical protein